MKKDELEIAYRKYYRSLFLFAFSLTQNREDAEDLVENAFVKAIFSFQEGNFHAWMYVVLKNEFYNEYKKRRRLVDEGKIKLHSLPSSLDILKDYIHNDELRWIYEQIYHLKQRERDIMLLSLQDELDDQTIANLLNLSVENVRMIRYRVKKKLKSLCQKEGYL